jgi:hypothetical protein
VSVLRHVAQCANVAHMTESLLNSREVAVIVGLSRSQINRDATGGKLPVAVTFPGYRGPRLFKAEDVRTTYPEALS